MAKLSCRHTVIDHFVEEGTQGLHYCRLEERSDEPPPPAGTAAATGLEELHARTRQLIQRVIEPVAVGVYKMLSYFLLACVVQYVFISWQQLFFCAFGHACNHDRARCTKSVAHLVQQ